MDGNEEDNVSRLSSNCKVGPGQRITARSMTLSNSRTFPGHG